MAMNKQIKELNEVGQSIWYDNLSRDMLEKGELAELISQGVSGLTSNPTIFQKAISKSDRYNDSFKTLMSKTDNDEELCEALMVEDVGNAADLLLPVFEATKGADGYASIEVSPFLANDTEATLEAARRIWKTLNRKNIMVKVPATPEGLPAIETLLYEGLNINITLIFDTEVYREVASAYIRALGKRLAEGKDVSASASVASFFVSRVDSICEKKFDELQAQGKVEAAARDEILGKVGIANSKVAYEIFEELFLNGAEFKKLEQAGAMVQRPLWASTGVKNDNFSPVLYVEELAGKHTVNTLPPATLDSLLEAAEIEPRLHNGLSEAKACISYLEQLGINLDELLLKLQKDGVQSFADSYQELLDAVAEKRLRLAA